MQVEVKIQAGVCGFQTDAHVGSEDDQHVAFAIETNCEKICRLAQVLADKGPVDAYQEISPAGPAVVMTAVRENLTGCCAGCAVPVGLFKAMQVAAGLALPKDIEITIRKNT